MVTQFALDLFKDPFFIGFNKELDRLSNVHQAASPSALCTILTPGPLSPGLICPGNSGVSGAGTFAETSLPL